MSVTNYESGIYKEKLWRNYLDFLRFHFLYIKIITSTSLCGHEIKQEVMCETYGTFKYLLAEQHGVD